MGPRVRGDDKCASSFSRQALSEVLQIVRALFKQRAHATLKRGRREDRVRAAPAVSCALMHKEMRTRAYRFSGNTPAFPAQWFDGLYALSLVACCATITPGSASFLGT